jgi:hypothetical protein
MYAMTLATMTSLVFKGQPALSGGRRPGDAISRGVCFYYTWGWHFVNKSEPFAQKMSRLTQQLEELIRANLKRLGEV